MDENSTVTSFDVGNVEAALATSEAVVKGSIETTRQEHFYEETMVALVVPIGEDNEYKIYHPTPNVLYAQHMVSISCYHQSQFEVKTFSGCHVPWSSLQQGHDRVKEGKNKDHISQTI